MRKAVALTAIIVLVFLVESIAIVTIANADPYPQTNIYIWSPIKWEEKTYQISTVPIEVQVDTIMQHPKITKIYCILDLNYSSNYNPQKQLSISNSNPTEYLGTGTLEHLSNGAHTLDAYALDAQGKTIKSGTTNFLVNATSTSPTANSDYPFIASNPAIILLIAMIAITIGIVTSVVLFKRKRHSQQVSSFP